MWLVDRTDTVNRTRLLEVRHPVREVTIFFRKR